MKPVKKKKNRQEKELAKLMKKTQQKAHGKIQEQEEKSRMRYYDSTLVRPEKSVEDSDAEEIFREMKRRDF